MARPKIPLISRRTALEAALKIIDEEGLPALSIRRLADVLGVNGASLYHHFANKADIVVGAAELALAWIRTPEDTNESWRTWLPRNSRMLRAAMLEHPELIPVIVGKVELGMGLKMMESSANRLVYEGVPLRVIGPLLEALEVIAIGSAVQGTRAAGAAESAAPPTLVRAASARALSSEELFDVVVEAAVEGLLGAAYGAASRADLAPGRPVEGRK